MAEPLRKTDPDYDAVRSRAFGHAIATGKLTGPEIDRLMEAGRAELAHDRRRGTAPDLRGVPGRLWRCRCGAVLTNEKARERHVAGKTMCQHQGEGLVEFAPSVPQPAGVPV